MLDNSHIQLSLKHCDIAKIMWWRQCFPFQTISQTGFYHPSSVVHDHLHALFTWTPRTTQKYNYSEAGKGFKSDSLSYSWHWGHPNALNVHHNSLWPREFSELSLTDGRSGQRLNFLLLKLLPATLNLLYSRSCWMNTASHCISLEEISRANNNQHMSRGLGRFPHTQEDRLWSTGLADELRNAKARQQR